MKSILSGIAAILSLGASALAQAPVPKGAPFYLVLSKANSTYDGTILEVCRPSRGIDALCAYGAHANASTTYSTFHFNKVSSAAEGSILGTGFLVWNSPQTNGSISNELLQLHYDPSSNVAFTEFTPNTEGFYVAFDANTLVSTGGYDDTQLNPNFPHGTAYNRWVICTSTFRGGKRPTLNWVLGRYQAQNPSCQTVRIVKQYVNAPFSGVATVTATASSKPRSTSLASPTTRASGTATATAVTHGKRAAKVPH